jgi:aspartyl-tRNA(Asn)/glutamyl-tRNA(Gln) amidotransferase subunit A
VTDWTATQTVEAVRAGEVSCTEVINSTLERCARVHRATGCFVELDAAAALRRAAAADRLTGEQRRAHPLLGLPYAYKDVFVHGGRAPGVGQRLAHLTYRAAEARSLADTDRAGGIAVGRLSLDPLGYTTTGLNDHLGDTRNPWDTSRISGGSSSGAAVAVAAGAVPVAIGTDTGGSVRIPAALCGVVGLKPTYGRISRRGATPVSYSQDTVGILARTVHDIALMLGVLAGHDPADPGSIAAPVPRYRPPDDPGSAATLDGLRIGVDPDHVTRNAGAQVATALDAACAVLVGLGARLVAVDLSAFAGYNTAAGVLTGTEVLAVHGAHYREHRSEYPEPVRTRLDLALMTPGSAHVDALRLQGRALRDVLRGVLGRCDLIATPAAGDTAPEVARMHGDPSAAAAVNLALLTLNRPYNFLGLPSMSVPIGFAGDGLPMAMQLAGRPWSEPTILRAGAAYQDATAWHTRRTPATA